MHTQWHTYTEILFLSSAPLEKDRVYKASCLYVHTQWHTQNYKTSTLPPHPTPFLTTLAEKDRGKLHNNIYTDIQQ